MYIVSINKARCNPSPGGWRVGNAKRFSEGQAWERHARAHGDSSRVLHGRGEAGYVARLPWLNPFAEEFPEGLEESLVVVPGDHMPGIGSTGDLDGRHELAELLFVLRQDHAALAGNH